MRNFFNKTTAFIVVMVLSPEIVFAERTAIMTPPDDALSRFINNVTGLIIQPIILLLFALAMFYFVQGAITFISKSDDPKARETGRNHMIWGVLGFFIMVSVFTILKISFRTFSPTRPSLQA